MVCSVGAPQQQAYANRGQSQPKTASQDLTTGAPAEPGRRIVGGRWPGPTWGTFGTLSQKPGPDSELPLTPSLVF